MSAIRPSSDVNTTGWHPSVGGTVFGTIDEAVYDDSDYTYKSLSAAYKLIQGLNASVSPGSHWVAVRLNVSSGAADVRVQLLDSSSVPVGSSDWTAITSTPAMYRFNIVTSAGASRLGIEITPTDTLLTEDGEPLITEDGRYLTLG